MKVVINRCWGGFEVSNMALRELYLMNSDCLKKRTPKEYYGDFLVPDFDEDLKKMGPICDKIKGHKHYSLIWDGSILYSLDNTKRSHPDLVRVVEMLGDVANGSHAELKVVEIPDGIEYDISDYDGMESIEEKHRTWS